MDNSGDLSTNDIEKVNMGNIFSSTNENDVQTSDTNINNTKSNNETKNFEVNNPPNPVTPSLENITSITTKIDNSDTQQLKNVEIKCVASSSNAEENMDMWLDGKTCELVKEDNEEDFDVIVKSLETAIVETEHYETESIQAAMNSSISVNTESKKDSDDSPMPSLMEMMKNETADFTLTTNDYINQSTNLSETPNKTNTGEKIDSELSEPSIVSASTEDNEETLLLNSSVESKESDFTLHLNEEHEINVLPSSKKDHENNSQIEKTVNVNEKTNVSNEDMKIVSVMSIVDYDDSSEEESAEVETNKGKKSESVVPINLDLIENKPEETSVIVGAIKLVEKPIFIENTENETNTDSVKVHESNDKIEMAPEINSSKLIDQPNIISEVKTVEKVTTIEPVKNTESKEIIEVTKVKSADIKLTESNIDLETQSIEMSDTDATTSEGACLKLEIDQHLEIKNVAEKIIMSLEESEEKPRAPPKKIKLIRQKLPTVVKATPLRENSSEQILEAGPNEMKTTQDSSKNTAADTNIKSEGEKSDIKLEESFESDEKLFSEIFKIEDEVENKPAKTQKLKLKRNYVTPPVVCKPQVLHSSVKIAEVVKEPVKNIEIVNQPVEADKEELTKELVTVVEPMNEHVKLSDVEQSVEIIKSVEEEPVDTTETFKELIEPTKEPATLVAPIEESVKTATPVEELIQMAAPLTETVKIVAPVEESVKTTPIEEPIPMVASVIETVKIIAPVEESVKTTPVEEPIEISTPVIESVKIIPPVEESVKITTTVEELIQIATPVEESEKIVAPVHEPVKIITTAEEPVEIDTPFEEPVKITAPVEESTKIDAPVEEHVTIDAPIEEPIKIVAPVEESVKITTPVEEPVQIAITVDESVKIATPPEESMKISTPIEEPLKITQSLEEPVKNIESTEEPIKMDETAEDNNCIKETLKLSVESIEQVSENINLEEEQSKIDERIDTASGEVKFIHETNDSIIEEVMEPVTKQENISEKIEPVENTTNVGIEESIPETSNSTAAQEIIHQTEDADEVDKITKQENIIEALLTDDLLKKIESPKEKDQMENVEEQKEKESFEINQELQEEIIPDVKETLQHSKVLVKRTKTPEPIISEPEKIIPNEMIEKEVILEPVKYVIEKTDSITEIEKIIDNLPETESDAKEKTDIIEKSESIPSVSITEEISVLEKNQQENIDISVQSIKVAPIEATIPITENLLQNRAAETNEFNVEKISEKPYSAEPIETEKTEPEPKKCEAIQFPLLMSRLQDKLHANMSKTSRSVGKIFAPQADFQKAEKPATVEPDTSHMKFRAMKRKHDAEVPARSVTKPLTVEIDDLESCDAMMQPTEHENIPKLVIKQMPKQEQRSSPKITIKPIKPPGSPDVSSKRSKISEDSPTTPRLTIKPLIKPDPLKITITKQKSDDTHSILKIYQPDEDLHGMQMQHSPKITIKPVKPPGSPKVTVKPVVNPEESYPKVTIKPVLKPEEGHKGTQISPRHVKLKSMTFDSSSGVTVEPVCGTSSSSIPSEHESPMKISVKSFAKIEDNAAPKLTIKPLTKTCEIVQSEDGTANPLKLTIKPILKPEESYQSPKITIKPIVKPDDHEHSAQHSVIEDSGDKPERIILKIQKTNLPSPKERTSTHVRKEPEVKIEAITSAYNPEHNQKLDKIKLKLTKEGSHAQIIPSVTTSHALTETGTSFSLKRAIPVANPGGGPEKRQKTEFSELLHSTDISINLVEPHCRQSVKKISEEVTIMKIDKSPGGSGGGGSAAESMTQMRLKEMLLKISQKPDITCTPHVKQIQQQQQQQREDSSSSDDVRIVEVMEDPLRDPLNEDSASQDVLIINEMVDANPFKNVQIINAQTVVEPAPQQQFTPKKRGRPRKVPLEVRPEIKGEDCVLSEANSSMTESPEGGRPKRTCRAPAGRTPFAVKERKPRGSGRGRGSTRGVRGAKALTAQKPPKEPKSPRGKALKVAKALAKLEAAKLAQEVIIDEITIEDSTNDTLANSAQVPQAESFLKKPDIVSVGMQMQMQMQMVEQPHKMEMKICEMTTATATATATAMATATTISEITDVKNASMSEIKNTSVSVYEEETRMSASENNSRAQTPARQVFIVPLSAEGPEESQSSVQSSATTESTKNKKGRLEICDPDSAHTTVEQIVEYSWGNGGPYMLQEQIAQFLGVKSFKRKYPGLTRRPVDMQERDYIKEKGLVSESMCDMGLTAVPSSEILDIMYTDFQEKYEEYRKCLRDKQSKEISNKQKAISLATSQEKNKIDFKERAIRSTANWNATFNKSRKESRKCCMDLQTYTVNYPTGKNYPRVPHKNPVGSYPIALVPGQFTDYFKAYSPTELNYLPLNTVRYGPILPNQRCLDPSDGSSESDSSSGSDSDSSDESMSTDDEAPSTPGPVSKHLTPLLSATPKTKVH